MRTKIAISVCFLLVFAAVFCFSSCKKEEDEGISELASQNENIILNENGLVTVPQIGTDESALKSDQGIVIRAICRMSPDIESSSLSHSDDVAGIEVYNSSSKTLRYAEIVATFQGGITHIYKVTTLPPGSTCFVSEENYSAYRELSAGFYGFEIKNVAYFTEEPSLYTDKFQFSGADGIINVKNISGSNITEDIVVYYKDYEDAQLSSGRTYRVTISGGLNAGEIKQVIASHYKQGRSILMFVQIVPAEVS